MRKIALIVFAAIPLFAQAPHQPLVDCPDVGPAGSLPAGCRPIPAIVEPQVKHIDRPPSGIPPNRSNDFKAGAAWAMSTEWTRLMEAQRMSLMAGNASYNGCISALANAGHNSDQLEQRAQAISAPEEPKKKHHNPFAALFGKS